MKNFKKIVFGFIVFITILGLVAFYFPVRNIPQPQTSSDEPGKYSASINPVSPTSTPSVATSSISTSTEKASFNDMSGFSDLSQENDLIKEMGANSSSSDIDDIFKDLNQ